MRCWPTVRSEPGRGPVPRLLLVLPQPLDLGVQRRFILHAGGEERAQRLDVGLVHVLYGEAEAAALLDDITRFRDDVM